MADAVVVGAGPNGLAAAVSLARAGVSVTLFEGRQEVGGGTRSSDAVTLPGLLHDHCSAVHPLGAASPFLRSLSLERHGLRWAWPTIDVAHPLLHGPAAVLERSLERTAAGLRGADSGWWHRLFGTLSRHFDDLAEDLLGPLIRAPQHPLLMARFAAEAGWPVTSLARVFATPASRALLAGVAAHSAGPLTSPASSGTAVALVAAGHSHGWPVAVGGSARISAALLAELEEHGGKVETGAWVGSLAELPRAEVTLLDVAPGAAVRICGSRLPAHTAAAYRRWRHGPAAFKLDLAVDGGVPWQDERCRHAGTVHVGGELDEIRLAEASVARGQMPERPFVLLAQQHVADPGRAVGSVVPVWAYAHVPRGWGGDATERILAQISRFAPGLRERIIALRATTVANFAEGNPNFVDGDILTGASNLRQSLGRPRLARDPYATGIPGVFLCSAATPPGPGVHGMCGFGAARSALSYLRSR